VTRWHRPGARPVERAREVARTCWAALSVADPEAADLIAWAATQAGETWLTPRPATYGPEDRVSPAEAAELVGVSVRTVYGWISSGRLDHSLNAQGRIRVRVDAVLATMALEP
jgi:excisionase family DNA binding protein